MSNGFQLIDALAKYKPSTSVYAGIKTSPTTSNHQHSNLNNNNNNNNNKNIQTNHQNELYIIKLIDLEDTNELDNDEFKLIQNEIKYAKSLRHRNVVSLLNCFVQHTQIWCIYPYMYYGSLKDIFEIINNIDLIDSTHLNNANVDKVDEQKRLCFNEQSLQSVAKSVLSALDYLHSKHIVHRCVCPENIYLSHDGKVYLGGFKYCVNLIENGVYRKLCYDYPSNKSIENYLTYHSPEMLQQNLIGYNTKTDIYSFGVTMCELANGENPFVGCENVQMLYEKLVGFDIGLWDRNILNPDINTAENPRLYASVQRRYFSEKFRNFVDLCVERNSDLRPSAAQLLTHLYLKKSKQTNSILTTLQMSIVSDGLIALNKRIKAVRQPEENHQETNQIKELNKTSNFNSTPLFQWHF